MTKVLFTFCSCLICTVLLAANVFAGQVTMAAYDFDGDGIDEIVRTDENAELKTNIRFYSKMKNSFFYSPVAVFEAAGRIVQVPEIVDVNKDGFLELFFSTGSDMGVIYYDSLNEKYVRTNDFSFSLSLDAVSEYEVLNDSIPPKEVPASGDFSAAL